MDIYFFYAVMLRVSLVTPPGVGANMKLSTSNGHINKNGHFQKIVISMFLAVFLTPVVIVTLRQQESPSPPASIV